MKAICITRCYFGGREWLPGEATEVGAGEIPAHFRAATESDPDDATKLKRVAPTTKAPQPETGNDRAMSGEPVAFSQLNKAADSGDISKLL